MDYMLACWKRVVQTKKSLRSPTPEKEAVIQEVKRLCMSYAIFAVTLPDLFRYAPSWMAESPGLISIY
jgi:ubiquitin conjugation factor E4 B